MLQVENGTSKTSCPAAAGVFRKVIFLDWLKKSKHRWMVPAYGLFYMITFMLVERSDVKIHIIHSLADDRIPFCKYFIIPYVLWYFFLIGTIAYFTLKCPSKREYYQYIATLGVGMTLFILISWVWPNGQNLRPELTGNDIFTRAIRFLYKIDTPTNIFPSMHVFNATASCIALYQNKKFRSNKIFTAFQMILTVSIVLSTMFLKQHCVSDVMTALILNIVCYQVFYRIIPAREEKLAEILTKKEICTLPNLLSTVRICIAILFLGICQRYGLKNTRTALTVLLILAVATDLLDGWLAKGLHQVSTVGKVLDPLANEIMQGVILACLMPYYTLAKLAFFLYIIKECYTVAAGWKAAMDFGMDPEAQWHVRLNTAYTYGVGLLILVVPRLSSTMVNALIAVGIVYMMLSFYLCAGELREVLESSGRSGQHRRVSRRGGENWIQ